MGLLTAKEEKGGLLFYSVPFRRRAPTWALGSTTAASTSGFGQRSSGGGGRVVGIDIGNSDFVRLISISPPPVSLPRAQLYDLQFPSRIKFSSVRRGPGGIEGRTFCGGFYSPFNTFSPAYCTVILCSTPVFRIRESTKLLPQGRSGVGGSTVLLLQRRKIFHILSALPPPSASKSK